MTRRRSRASSSTAPRRSPRSHRGATTWPSWSRTEPAFARALGTENDALDQALAALPDVLAAGQRHVREPALGARRPERADRRLQAADQGPGAVPAAVRAPVRDDAPTFADLRGLVNQPGPRNDSVDLMRVRRRSSGSRARARRTRSRRSRRARTRSSSSGPTRPTSRPGSRTSRRSPRTTTRTATTRACCRSSTLSATTRRRTSSSRLHPASACRPAIRN